MVRPIKRIALLAALAFLGAPAGAQSPAQATKTRVVLLGVEHSGQLVSRAARAAVLEAYIARVAPDAICIERDPARVAMNDYYEFTYEVTGVTVPYAQAHHIAICPIDWVPPAEDGELAFGSDLNPPPVIRPKSGFQGFVAFDADALRETLFWAEDPKAMPDWDAFVDKPEAWPGPEMARRLFLYRTALQERRIAAAAHARPGKTVLVIVGADHIRDLKSSLGADAKIDLVASSAIGLPSDAEVAAHDDPRYLYAALNFNLLGVQGDGHPVDWPWMRDMLTTLGQRDGDSAELALFRLRLARLTGAASATATLAAYRELLVHMPKDAGFTWTGVQDHTRVDSYFDPFGNLSLHQRLQLEIGRELYASGHPAEAEAQRAALAKLLSPTQAAQLSSYWDMFIRAADDKPPAQRAR
jgi:hypothetical protein